MRNKNTPARETKKTNISIDEAFGIVDLVENEIRKRVDQREAPQEGRAIEAKNR